MENKQVYAYKQIESSIHIYRVYGLLEQVHIPSMIHGIPVTHIGQYCFAKRNQVPSDVLYTDSIEGLFELAGDTIETIDLGSSIVSIDSFSFYGCRKLKSLSIPKTLQSIGSDIFINCHALHDLMMDAKKEESTLLKQILTQISWDVDVHFQDGTFFYPEYYETYDEIGPAHVFSQQLSGEGFRLRQCFHEGKIMIDEYEKPFEKMKAEESLNDLLHFAFYRWQQGSHTFDDFLKKHQQGLCLWLLEREWDKKALISIFEALIQAQMMDAITCQVGLDTVIKKQDVELITHFIQWRTSFQKEDQYEFEDF